MMSDVESGAVLTLVVPLSLLVVVLALWAFAQRRTFRGRRSQAVSRRDG
jgi:hypothetical protein